MSNKQQKIKKINQHYDSIIRKLDIAKVSSSFFDDKDLDTMVEFFRLLDKKMPPLKIKKA